MALALVRGAPGTAGAAPGVERAAGFGVPDKVVPHLGQNWKSSPTGCEQYGHVITRKDLPERVPKVRMQEQIRENLFEIQAHV